MGEVTRATRVAYVKFMRKKMAADEVSIGEVEENKSEEEKKADMAGVSIYPIKDYLSKLNLFSVTVQKINFKC